MNNRSILGFILLTALAVTGIQAQDSGPDSEPAPQVQQAEDQGTVYIIPIRGMISPVLLAILERQVAEAQADGARAIIFPMRTPGGAVNTAESIIDLIASLEMPTYTFVERDAISAGALIALGTDAIYMAPGSKIGDALPYIGSPFGGPVETPDRMNEKMETYVAASARATAVNKGHNPEVAEAMVRMNFELVIDDVVISPAGQILTLTHEEASREYGDPPRPLLSSGTVKDVDALLVRLGLDQLRRVEQEVSWSEKMARVITGIAPILLVIGVLGIYVEIRTPGFGLPGIGGALCLLIYFWGHHVAGLAGNEEILIFLIGVALLLVELFVIPGFGIVGFTGIMLMLVGLFLAMVDYFPGMPVLPHLPGLRRAFMNLLYAIAGSSVGILVIGRFLPQTSLFRRLVLEEVQGQAVPRESTPQEQDRIGETGVALTALHPSGIARLGDERRDVLSRSGFIQAGTRVRIVRVEGSRITVEPEE